MSGQRFTLTFDAQLNVSQMKGAISSIQGELSRLQLPPNLTSNLTSTLSKLEKEIRTFEIAAGKDLGNKVNFNAFERSAERISSLFKDLQIQTRDLGNIDVEKLFPSSVVNNINRATQALNQYDRKLQQIAADEKRAQGNLTRAENRQTVIGDNLKVAQQELETFKNQYQTTLEQLFTKVKMDPKNIFDPTQVEQALNKVKELFERYNQIQNGLTSKGQPFTDRKKEKAQQDEAALNALISTYQRLAAAIPASQANVDKLISSYERATNKVKEMQLALDQVKQASTSGQAEAIRNVFEELNRAGINTSGFKDNIDGARAALALYAQTARSDATNAMQAFTNAVNNNSSAQEKNRQDVMASRDAFNIYDQRVSDVSALKSRIQYFFGLNNAINLIKRAIRGAINTIKELDKTMTETAVVTDFTVNDMWKQLPEYTKRANQLGVTTNEAYKAATLYYQQGLNTEQVSALSVETLKMARIAGLDAAEATDRMTNALRGFNMELTSLNAQRIDDVYSELAANTASNVDEISTAMTKVASLAHNANMEFETTAAFLAQIIETTRESAETAGTALKTVVARFSEVKKLVSEGMLEGQDEEGSVIDVNKVSAALRTAGIDLNKYFLGEVGLDDIFMELASKWDTLTNIQQRYIATQAAGSRQQSRFIALMQDYARTQELVSKAYKAEGAAARQFSKTQDSLESKLARLKNAWNEFLMGLANNVVVKGFVDLLTTLLNTINKLTSAFGDGAGSILKWMTAIMAFRGIKRLFMGGGLVDRALMSTLAGTALGGAMVKGGVLSGLTLGGAQLTAQTAGTAAAMGAGGSLIGNLAGKAWGGAKNLGAFMGFGQKGALMGGLAGSQLTGSAGLVAGLGGITTALGAIAVAVAAAYGAYKLWQKVTPAGQLQKAKKEAEKLKKVSEETEQDLESKESLRDTYKEKTEQIENATTNQDRKEAVEARNKAVLDAVKEDGTLAKYVVTEVVDNEIVITIDEDALANAIEKASKEARDAEITSGFAQAKADLAQAALDLKKLHDLAVNTGMMPNEIRSAEGYFERIINSPMLNEKQKTQAAELYKSITSSYGSAEQQAKLTYAYQLQELTKNENLINQLLPLLSEVFKENHEQLSDQALKNILGLNQTSLTEILEAWAGKGKMAELNLDNIDIDSEEFWNQLGLDAELLGQFAEYLGEDVNVLKSHIKQQARNNRDIQRQAKTNIYEQALKSGLPIDEKTFEAIKSLGPEVVQQISDIIDQTKDLISEETFADFMPNLLTLNTDDLKQYTDFFKDFSLDNPIQALSQLNAGIKEFAGTDLSGILKNIKEFNSSIFSTSNIVQSFLLSSDYEGLNDTIKDLKKNGGQIDASNIEEMAESCSDLNSILEETTVTAQGLAETFNLYEEGKLAIEGITDELLAALSAGDDFNSMLGRTLKSLEELNKGEDLSAGATGVKELIEEAQGYVEKFQLGNRPLKAIYDYLFGDNAYADLMKQAQANGWSSDEIAARLNADLNKIAELVDNDGLAAIEKLSEKLANVTKIGEDEYEWDLSGYEHASDAIEDVAKSLGVSESAAEALILAWASHMPTLEEEWSDLNFKDKIQAYTDALGDSTVITQEELDALAASTGKTAEEVIAAINEMRDVAGDPIVFAVDWSGSGENILEQIKNLGDDFDFESIYKDAIKSVMDENHQVFDTIDFQQLTTKLVEALKLTPAQAEEVANALASDLQKPLSQEIEIPVVAEDGSITTMKKVIYSETAEGLRQVAESETLLAQYKIISEQLANITSFDQIKDSIITSGEAGLQDLLQKINEANPELKVGLSLSDYDQAVSSFDESGIETITQFGTKAQFDSTISQMASDIQESISNGIENGYIDGMAAINTGLTDEASANLIATTLQSQIDEALKNSGATAHAQIETGLDGTFDIVLTWSWDESVGPPPTSNQLEPDDVDISSEDIEETVEETLPEEIEITTPVSVEVSDVTNADSIIDAIIEQLEQESINGNDITFSFDSNELAWQIFSSLIGTEFGENTEIEGNVITVKFTKESIDVDTPPEVVTEVEEEITEELPDDITKNITIKPDVTIDTSGITDLTNIFDIISEQLEHEASNGKIVAIKFANENIAEQIQKSLTESLLGAFADITTDGAVVTVKYDYDITPPTIDFSDVDSASKESAEQINAALAEEIDSGLEKGSEGTVKIQTSISDLDTAQILAEQIEAGGETGGIQAAASIRENINTGTYDIVVNWSWADGVGPTPGGNGGDADGEGAATGGIVKSYAKGSENFHVKSGTALTGEEGPEIVWNKDQGYAYVTGETGPEFQDLQPGDRVFNAEETKRILHNSLATGGVIESYAKGKWSRGDDDSGGGSGGNGGGSGSGDKQKTSDEWKNELDWLYNLMEDIDELEREQTDLQHQYERYLTDQSKTGKDLYNLLIKQLGNLHTQLDHQTTALSKREQEMREFMKLTNDQPKYLSYNWQDRTLEIDWEAIDKIEDEELYKHVKDLINEAEAIQDKMDEAEDAINDIEDQIAELENIWRDTFVDFEKRVYDAVVKQYQKVIDNFSELNDTLNNSNAQILDALQKQVSLQRQIRDNTKTEEQINNDEARLAYLRRDTSGGNDLAALQLQKELDEQRQSYEDTLVDQAISRLQDDNNLAAQQRDKQIELMQAQLDYQNESGAFNAYVRDLLDNAISPDGTLLTDSDLVNLLKETENWEAMSEVSKEVWEEELNNTFKEVVAFLLKQQGEETGQYYKDLTAAIKSISAVFSSYSQAMKKLGDDVTKAASGGGSGGNGGGSGGDGGSGASPSGSGNQNNRQKYAKLSPTDDYLERLRRKFAQTPHRFATGGLTTKTGPAILDGTPSEPEYVLNAEQTDAFLKLADVLPSMMNSSASSSGMTFGNTYFNLQVSLDSVSPDYDVDRMVSLVKEKLYDSGTYRNVNSLSFTR